MHLHVMNAEESLLWIGAVCVVAAVIGGGIKLSKMEIPKMTSIVRQILLFLVGAALIGTSFIVKAKSDTNGPPPPSSVPGPQIASTVATPSVPATRITASPAALDFGDVAVDEEASEYVAVTVEGVDDTTWTMQSTGAFFKTTKTESGILVRLGKKPGRYRGAIVVSSQAGQTVIKVRANVVRPSQLEDVATDEGAGEREPEQRRPRNVDISGRWNLNGGMVVFKPTGHIGRYQFTELTSAAYLGANVAMGQGQATVTGNEVTLTGQNHLVGPWSAEAIVNGGSMTGTAQWFGNVIPLALQRLHP